MTEAPPEPDPAQPALLSSAKAPRVKAARRLSDRAARSRERLFLAEGPQAVREALRRPGTVTEVFATSAAAERHPDLRAHAERASTPWRPVSGQVLSALAETVRPQGLVAVCRFVDVPLTEFTAAQPALVAVGVSVRDPGNVGTLLRCADAAGAGGVVVAGTSVDPYNGKAVRASAGSLFHVPLIRQADPATALAELRRVGLAVLAADAAGDVALDAAMADGRLAAPTAWVFGNEAWGLPEEIAAAADAVVRVPIHGRAESLNLASAAAVCLYASAYAQRRPGGS